MPELPEVETVANGVHERVHGQTIVSVWTSGKPQTFKSTEAEIAEVLTGARMVRVRRVGKTIVVTLQRDGDSGGKAEADPSAALRDDKDTALRDDRSRAVMGDESSARGDKNKALRGDRNAGARHDDGDGRAESATGEFLIHLGMTGRLLVSAPAIPLPPHTHAVLTLSAGNELRFVDARRFGRLSVRRIDPTQQAYGGPGAEPLTISEADFIALFRGRRTPIKAALLNQSLLHGIGNIYADESLFRAKIRPRRQAGRLTRAELLRLRTALIEVLHHAIELGGSSVSDYVDADGVRGFFQLQHKVYGRVGELCKDCATPLKKLSIGGRTTIFCPKCQR